MRKIGTFPPSFNANLKFSFSIFSKNSFSTIRGNLSLQLSKEKIRSLLFEKIRKLTFGIALKIIDNFKKENVLVKPALTFKQRIARWIPRCQNLRNKKGYILVVNRFILKKFLMGQKSNFLTVIMIARGLGAQCTVHTATILMIMLIPVKEGTIQEWWGLWWWLWWWRWWQWWWWWC